MSQKLDLTIRATNGASWETSEFSLEQPVHHVLKVAVDHFVRDGVMAKGDYALALVSDGRAVELADSASLEEAHVQDHSVLVLLVRGPQVDG